MAERLNATILVAVARNGTIGRDNQLPWKLRSDLIRFKRLTMGHALIMGRKTFESIGRVLPGRTTVVLSRSGTFSHSDIMVASSVEEALKQLPPQVHPFIVGGSEIYRQTISLVNRIMLTRVLAEIEGDATFPDWDRALWRLTYHESEPQSPKDDWPTVFEIWER